MAYHELTTLTLHTDAKKAEEQWPQKTNSAIKKSVSRPNLRPAVFHTTFHEVVFVFIATMGVAMPSLLQGCTIVISSSVKRDLNMSTTETTWITASSA
jgi:hypothetical protein